MKKRTKTYRITEGPYTAEVEIEVEDGDGPWMPWMTGEEAQKLDKVRLALRRGDVVAAQRDAITVEEHELRSDE